MQRALAFALVLAACVDHPASQVVLSQAQDDLDCADVTLEELSFTYEPLKTAVYRATGCDQTSRYTCVDYQRHPYVDYDCTLDAHTTATSTVAINGVPLVPSGEDLCRSGVSEGQAFYGVDLASPGGDTLRLLRNPDLSYAVLAIAASGDHSPPLTGCATIAISDDSLAGLDGTASIACTSDPWTVTGEITFQGCE